MAFIDFEEIALVPDKPFVTAFAWHVLKINENAKLAKPAPLVAGGNALVFRQAGTGNAGFASRYTQSGVTLKYGL
jgi:hypothetical protein